MESSLWLTNVSHTSFITPAESKECFNRCVCGGDFTVPTGLNAALQFISNNIFEKHTRFCCFWWDTDLTQCTQITIMNIFWNMVRGKGHVAFILKNYGGSVSRCSRWRNTGKHQLAEEDSRFSTKTKTNVNSQWKVFIQMQGCVLEIVSVAVRVTELLARFPVADVSGSAS